MRLGLFLGSLVLALLIGAWALQVPAARPADAPTTAFSATRAMVDVREIAQAPHPLGSAEHARVRQVLVQRMTDLGLSPTLQTGPLSPDAVARLKREGGDPASVGNQATNIVGRLAGRDPSAPAVMMMAHYDTAAGSPGAADDSTGVAAILESVRAIRARGLAERDLIVLITDAEELNLDGARIFFGDHPWRDRIGTIVNLEARGGGGRASMFETGIGNTVTIAVLAHAAPAVDGGINASSLGGYVYALTPNGTDFTVPRERGIGGLNFAFIGRPSQYHSPSSTPDALDVGAVQNLGSSALETTDALLRAERLPQAGPNRVYSDYLGRFLVQHSTGTGWLLAGLALALFVVAVWRSGYARRAGLVEIGRGMLGGLWLMTTGLVVIQAVRMLAGPLASRAESSQAYYTLLRRLPWMEAATVLTVLAVALTLMAGRDVIGRRLLAGLIAVAGIAGLVVGGLDPALLVAALIAIGLTLWKHGQSTTVWGGWLGLIGLVLALALIGQALAPEAGFLFVWTGLAGALVAAITTLIDRHMDRPVALLPAAIATVVMGAWLVGLGHQVFLGIGMDLPGTLMLVGLLALLVILPLTPRKASRALAACAAACLILACGVSLSARLAEPMIAPSSTGPS